MKTWQFLALASAIYVAPLKPNAVNLGLSILFGVAAIIAVMVEQ